jgi:hypothetical protein
MAIRVTCPGCLKRFSVGDQFAGKKGPCPACKAQIVIPAKETEVVIHGPDGFGPKGAEGRAILKPIFREESNVSPLMIVSIVLSILVIIGIAIGLRFNFADLQKFPKFPTWPIALGALVLAVPCCLAGYLLLKNDEAKGYAPKEMWSRVAICGVVYALLWLFIPIVGFAGNESFLSADGYPMWIVMVGLGLMVAAGGSVAMMVLEFEFLIGVIHYFLYLGVCVLLRWVVNAGWLPIEGWFRGQ